MNTFDSYPQKRLACFACRDKKLRCNTIQGEICQRCSSNNLNCIRPSSKRKASSPASLLDHDSSSSSPPKRKLNEKSSLPLAKSISRQKRTSLSTSDNPSLSSTSSSTQTHTAYVIQQDLLPIESAEGLFSSALESRKSIRNRFSFGSNSDQITALDPIICGILTIQEAKNLFDQFHQTFGKTLAYFDQKLTTFSTIRSRSYTLISVICLTMARAQRGSESLAKALANHVHHVVLPAILLQNLKSVELVQALLMLAAFEPPSEKVREDQSWTLLSHASRIASEINLQEAFDLNFNRSDQDESEIVQRENRNAQRTWINLWLHEFSLAQHTGRRSILAEQDLFDLCKKWHLHPLACYTDKALVSMIELRTIIKRNRQLFFKLPQKGQLFYIEQCKSDLNAWSRTWYENSSSMPRLELASLYVNHALVQLIGLALHNIPVSQWMTTMIIDLYQSCSAYLEDFPIKLPLNKLLYCYNSMFVAATYESVVAIQLTKFSSRFTFIDVEGLRSKCYRVLNCLVEVANLSSKETAANSYSKFLQGVLKSLNIPITTDDTITKNILPLNTILSNSSGDLNQQDLFTHFETDFDLGFDDLQFFAWAGASLAQNDDFLNQLFGDGRIE